MEDKLSEVKKILSKYNQEHLIQFYSELTEKQKSLATEDTSKVSPM